MKYRNVIRACLITAALMIMPFASFAVATDIHVAPDGDDAAAGTLGDPLATIQGARDRIRESKLDTGFADGVEEITLSAWINPEVEAGYIGILSSTGEYFALNIVGTGNGNKVDFRAGNELLYSADNIVPINQWSHLVGVWKRGEIHKMYVNGSLVATNPGPSTDPIDPDMWYLATDRLINGRYFNGETKGVHVWTRALSTSEISAMAADDSLIPATPILSRQELTDFDGINQYDILNTLPLPEGGIDVHFRGGQYKFTTSTTMTAADSGEPGKTITYKAYGDEQVIFDGSTALSSVDFSLVTDPTELGRMGAGAAGNVYRLQVSESAVQAQLGKVNAVLDLDGKMAQVSRYPNVGNTHIASVLDEGAVYAHGRTPGDPPAYDMANPIGAEITLLENDASRWETEFQSAQKAQLTGYLANDWYKETHRIADITSGVIKLLEYSRYGVSTGATRRLFVLNLLCELDAPGEWWFDEATNVLYVWPYEAITAASRIGVWNSPDFLKLYCNHVTFENLVIQGTSISTESGSGMVTFYAGDQTKFTGCTFRNTSRPAVSFMSSGTATNSGIIGCDLYDAGMHLGLSGGVADSSEITAGGNYAINCHFTQINARDYLGRINVRGVGNIFKNNLVHNLPDNAIRPGGYDHTFELNEMFNCGFEAGDGAAMYWSAGMETYGNTYRHNFLHHLMCTPGLHSRAGFYADQLDAGDNYEENVFYKAADRAILLNGGAGHSALRNVFLNGTIGIYQTEAYAQSAYDDISLYDNGTLKRGDVGDYIWRAEQVVGPAGWNSEPWLSHFPSFATVMNQTQMRFWPIENHFIDNMFFGNASSNFRYNYGGGSSTTDITTTPSYIGKSGNMDISLDVFEDPNVLNLQFKEPRPGYAPPIPFDLIGLYIGDGRKEMPNKALYRNTIKRHFEGRPSYDASAVYDPATINGLMYWNTGQLLSDIQNIGEWSGTDTLLSYWLCDESSGSTASDRVGPNFAQGVNFSGDEWSLGVIGNAVDLDGNSPKVDRPNYTGSNQKLVAPIPDVGDGATELSMSLWVNPDINHDGRDVGDGSVSSGARGYYGLLTTAAGSPQYWGLNFVYSHLSDGDFNTTGIDFRGHSGGLKVYGNAVTAEGGWFHVAGVWNGAEKILYIDGTEVARQAAVGPPVDVSTWQLGQDRDIADRYFDGQVDDVALFRSALTPSDVSLIHALGRSRISGISATDPRIVAVPVQTATVDQASGDLTLTWDPSAHPGSFSVLTTTDLLTWTVLDDDVATPPFTHAGAARVDPKRFYLVLPHGN